MSAPYLTEAIKSYFRANPTRFFQAPFPLTLINPSSTNPSHLIRTSSHCNDDYLT